MVKFVGLVVHFVAPVKVVVGAFVTLTVSGDSGLTGRGSVEVARVLDSSGVTAGVLVSGNFEKVVCGLTEGILGETFTVVSVCGETREAVVEMMAFMGLVEEAVLVLVGEVTDAVVRVVGGTTVGTLMPEMNK